MNDEELERMLRSQAGPRERGYAARPLPAMDGREPAPTGGRVLRIAVLASAAAAGALVVAIGAAALMPGATRDPGVGSGSSDPTPTVAASPTPAASPQTGACTPADVDLSAEAWGGAAGSRGTVVTLALRAGHDACTLGQTTGAWLTDASGSTLVQADPMSADAIALLLDGQHAYTAGVAWSNWCDAGVSGDVTVHLQLLGGVELEIAPAGAAAAVPPCMGNAGTTLSVTDLQPAP